MNRKWFFVVFGVVILNFFAVFWLFYYGDALAKESFEEDLSDFAERKIAMLDNYLESEKQNILNFSRDGRIVDILSRDLVESSEGVERGLNRIARVIAREAENHLRVKSNSSLEDLEKDLEFWDIVVQRIGERGYSVGIDAGSLIMPFHYVEESIGSNLLEIELDEDYLDLITRMLRGDKVVNGFYDWREVSGEFKRKYGSFRRLDVSTSDNVSLIVGATDYVEDYKMVEVGDNEESFLREFRRGNDYENLALVSADGYVVFMANEARGFGINLEWDINLDDGFSKCYFESKSSEALAVCGPFVRNYGESSLMLSVFSPVFEDNKLFGYVAVLIVMDDVDDIVGDLDGLGETGEAYLIDSDKLLISPLRKQHLDLLVQSIDTENSDSCFSSAYGDAFENFFNYRGEEVFGISEFISDVDWCLLVEISKDEVLSVRFYDWILIFIVIVLDVFLVLYLRVNY